MSDIENNTEDNGVKSPGYIKPENLKFKIELDAYEFHALLSILENSMRIINSRGAMDSYDNKKLIYQRICSQLTGREVVIKEPEETPAIEKPAAVNKDAENLAKDGEKVWGGWFRKK